MLAHCATQLLGLRARLTAAAAAAPLALVAMACGETPNGEVARGNDAALGEQLADLTGELLERGRDLVSEVRSRPLGEFRLTYYVIAREPERPADDDNADLGIDDALTSLTDDVHLASAAGSGVAPKAAAPGRDLVPIHDDSCEPIAEVSREFARDLRMQGTGVLRDGRMVSAGRQCDCDAGGVCFFLPGERYRWGIGAANRSLSPFRSVAVDTDLVPLGATLYIPELDGLQMPGPKPWGGFVHDGCVIADDRGGGVRGKHLDFFTARHGYYRALLGRYGLTSVTAYDGAGRCDELGEGRRPAT
jgi:3D (Asp-Asp-Asp) domain-containing protein